MKYFEVMVVIVLCFGVALWFWLFYCRIRRDYYGKTIAKALLRQQPDVFISPAVAQLTTVLLRGISRNNRRLLDEASSGHINNAIAWLQKHRRNELATALQAMSGQTYCGTQLIIAAWCDFNSGQFDDAFAKATEVYAAKKPKYDRALATYILAWQDLRDGDLLSASEKGTAAGKLFLQLGAYYEEGLTYILLGTVYRVSAMSDVAQLMLRNARQIFHDLQATKKEAESLGSLGMLMAAQERQSEAEENFAAALGLYQSVGDGQGEAEILNQQALFLLANEDDEAALRLAQQALQLHRGLNNMAGVAFSNEILARLYNHRRDWPAALRAAEIAQGLYEQAGNWAGMQEAAFAAATAAGEQNDFGKAEAILRQIIETDKQKRSCFHVANAYTLLGNIYLKQGDLRRAKGLFQQSLDCELASERLDGIAIDYANLALIEYRRGQQKQGDKARATALEYAKAYGESALSQQLEKKLSNNPN